LAEEVSTYLPSSANEVKVAAVSKKWVLEGRAVKRVVVELAGERHPIAVLIEVIV
jgi:hypothetical protein